MGHIKLAKVPRYQTCALQDSWSTRILVTIPCYDSATYALHAAPFYAAAAVVAAPTPGVRTHELILKRARERSEQGLGKGRDVPGKAEHERASVRLDARARRAREEGGFGAREGKREEEKNVLAPT